MTEKIYNERRPRSVRWEESHNSGECNECTSDVNILRTLSLQYVRVLKS
jgi:hypothetical protein